MPKIVVRRTWSDPSYMADCINNQNLAHAVLSWAINNGEQVVIFKVHTYEEEQRIFGLPT